MQHVGNTKTDNKLTRNNRNNDKKSQKIHNANTRWFLRAKAECFARLCHRLGVRPSVRPSVTLVSCIKTVQARTTKSSPWTAPRSLGYRDKISCHWVQGFPTNEGVEEGYPP